MSGENKEHEGLMTGREDEVLESDEGVEDDVGASDASKEADIEKKLKTMNDDMNAKIDASAALARLMSDPQVRMVLDAQQKGIAIDIRPKGSEAQVPQPEVETNPIDVESLTQSQLADYIIKTVSKATAKAVETQVSKVVEPINNQMSLVRSFVDASQRNGVVQQIEAAKGRYKDFEDYRPAMAKLSGENPALNIDQLYILAKAEVTRGTPARENVDSERPTSISARPSRRVTPMANGRQGFQQSMSKALEKLDLTIEGD